MAEVTEQQFTTTLDRTLDQTDTAAVLVDAVAVIDAALAKMMQRELVSSTEVADLLLDVRSLLTSAG